MTTTPNPPTPTDGDLAGREFWNSLWGEKREGRGEIGNPRLRHSEIPHAEMFDRAFAHVGDPKGKKILEIGAGDSGWLPYFAKRWQLEVSGLDYSPVGCARASDLMQRAGVPVDMICADMFAPPASALGSFDIVLSIGVAEHYSDTAGTLRAMARFLKPGGILVTTVPNIPGLVGDLFKVMNRPVYDIHVPLDEKRLRAAHEAAGLRILQSGYFMSLNLGVPNAAGLPSGLRTTLKKLLLAGMIVSSRAVWWLERHTRPFPAHPYFSPYVVTVARAE